ncbi:MAG: response regulator [candidate division Zixibacteria bacterium]|nr:response regulator [candidate division Zixibacteria bacterium]
MQDTNPKSILIVDDEEIIREFLLEVLGEDYRISVACDGDEAIAKIKERRFDLIITDLKMPRVSGEEVVKFARQVDPDYQVVVISGYSTLFSVSESAKSGASAFLSKPFSISDLMKAVTECIEQ